MPPRGKQLKGGAPGVQQNRTKKRQTTLFDAVAGRVATQGFLSTNPSSTQHSDMSNRSTVPQPPEKVLFRLNGRSFQGELDPYWAHEKLTEDQRLPDSDLVKAIHTYASDFYSKNFGEDAKVDYQSLDETALLCLGMLMEEMADEVLGETGDLALTEGELVESRVRRKDGQRGEDDDDIANVETRATSVPLELGIGGGETSSKPKSSKRRKIKHDAMEL